ncbi:DgyrCDS5628 [Dimorphilus gyrociliatus]|uniref:DgyrCDS5628 n=1 Tax=Dimorphilus gyrociliatus TaxID=2664684 RepID=A0A7I8VKH0_9ANNE|nr:DgyrCDS5628 [Dimorphilus gyrociliatus]
MYKLMQFLSCSLRDQITDFKPYCRRGILRMLGNYAMFSRGRKIPRVEKKKNTKFTRKSHSEDDYSNLPETYTSLNSTWKTIDNMKEFIGLPMQCLLPYQIRQPVKRAESKDVRTLKTNFKSNSTESELYSEGKISTIYIKKVNGGLGLSIVAARAKGSSQSNSGIFVKMVLKNGAAYFDGRLKEGDQLLEVNWQTLLGVREETAAHLLKQSGPVVRLKVKKGAAFEEGVLKVRNGFSYDKKKNENDLLKNVRRRSISLDMLFEHEKQDLVDAYKDLCRQASKVLYNDGPKSFKNAELNLLKKQNCINLRKNFEISRNGSWDSERFERERRKRNPLPSKQYSFPGSKSST